MMIDGKYLYCIIEGSQSLQFKETGLFDRRPYPISYKEIRAVVSSAPFEEIQPDAEKITNHHKIVEESRKLGTTLPVRFGIMFKSDNGVRKMLEKSYNDLKSKIVKLKDKDEYGLKIMIELLDLKKFNTASSDDPEIRKIKKEISSSGKGTAYFLKMKMDEAIKNETYKRIDQLSGYIHGELAKSAEESCLLKADFDQIMLNAAYLIKRDEISRFRKKLDKLKEKYDKDGFIFHFSGPWAPYSFC